ncbi:hypothetical protein [Bradyrhizobium forestalis]|uniref:hypothetical protein n=1 Tax=Bradyrhizobium forestalis TaxID=1419263 RepID=UPI0011AF67CD|nr:hypothetical protein [Bradyrhizobium forestalis]
MVDERDSEEGGTQLGFRFDFGSSSESDSPVSGSHQKAGLGKVTRRDFLVGGGATFVATPLAAAEARKHFLDVAYEDRTRRGLVIAWFESGKRYAWTLRASIFTDPDLPNGRGRFILRRTHDGWRADIAQCALPGDYKFALRIEMKWDPAFDPGKPTTDLGPQPPSMTIILRRGADISLQIGKNLIDFLKAEPQSVDEIGTDLSTPQLADLIQTLFGDSFDSSKASQSSLAFHREFYWILRAGKKLGPNEAETAAAKQSRFRALADEGVSLQFRECIFTVFSGSKGAEATKAFILNQNAKDDEKQDVRALFSGDGAPPAPDSTLSSLSDDEASRAAVPPPISAPGAGPPRDLAEEQRLAPRVLYALVRHDAMQTKANPQDAWSGTLALGRHSGGERGNLVIGEGKESSFLGWRNQGDNRPVLALRMPWMRLDLRREQTAVPSQFDDLKGLLWRAPGEDGKLRLIASLTPTKRKMRIETHFGRFTVAPLPPIAPRSGVSARVPSIRVGGTGPKNTRTLNHFAAPLALEEAGIPLSSARLSEIERRRAARLDDSGGSPAERAARLFSQLTFHETECLFHIDKLARRYVWKGVLPPATEPPQAEAVIHIGAKKAANELPLPARLSLSAASLLVRRPADLLALKYRFQDLLLEYGEAGWWVAPDRRIAAFVPRGEPKPVADVALVCNDKPLPANSPARYELRQDPRPLLVVEFPPQHIAEQAYLRQLAAEPDLPKPPSKTEVTAAEAEILRSADENKREEVRADIEKRQTAGLPADDPFFAFHKPFKEAIDDANKPDNVITGWKSNIPKDQRIYVGPDYLDLEAARVARKVARGLQVVEDWKDENLKTPDQRARLLRGLPEVELSPTVIQDLRESTKVPKDLSEAYPEPVGSAPAEKDEVKDYLEKRERSRVQRDTDYEAFRKFYASSPADRKKPIGLTKEEKDAIDAVPNLPGPFYGKRSTIARVEVIAKSNESLAISTARAIVATVNAYDLDNAVVDPFEIPTEARVSGGSRLVFRIPADDFESGRPDARDGAPAGAFPFTIEALTNWGAFDLAVVRRAEKVFEPLAGVQNSRPKAENGKQAEAVEQDIANGRFPPRWARQETRDEAARLLHQGISRGDAWAVRRDEQRSLTGASSCPPPLARLGSVTAPQRLAEVAASVRPPGLYETSIEMPFRLMLSPAQDAAWRTPLGLPPIAKLAPAKDVRWSQSAPVPLWFAQLDEAPGSSSMRAIWSPDFRPEALLDPDLGGPPHGPWAPWAMAREVTARNPYTKPEPVSAFPGQKPDPKDPERFRTGLDVADRHELVALTSLHGLPVRGRRKEDGTLADGSQINPPPGFKLRYAATESLKTEPPDDYSAIYRPKPLGVGELTLTALGGSFDADTNFVPPASAKIVPVSEWPTAHGPGKPLFDAFSVERWQQSTRLGRDIRVEVVYKGFLFPVGHRASLVKLTERRFMMGPGGLAAGPVAFLVQRFFLRIGAPIKTFPALAQPNEGRRWPVERLEILTRVTPDVLDPADAAPSDTSKRWEEAASGRIFLRQSGGAPLLPGLVFWPRVRAREGGEVNFELQIDARGARTRLPLIFVDNTAANDVGTMKVLTEEYNLLSHGKEADPRRVLPLGGSKHRYAPESEPDGTSFDTRQWLIAAEGREEKPPRITDAERRVQFQNTLFDFGPLLQGVDQPPFYPVMAEGLVRIAQVDRLVGRPSDEIAVFFDAEYLAFGFPDATTLKDPKGGPMDPVAKTDVYLDFRKPVTLDPKDAGDRTGGAVRPNTALVAMSRSRGPVGNSNYHAALKTLASDPPPASTGLDKPKPETFFGDATILGILDLKQAISFLGGGLSSAPEFREVAQYTSALLTDLTQAGDAGAAVAKVRDRLLVPMREALLTLARQFFDAIKQDTGAVFEENDAITRIERLYPDVGRSYRELKNALDDAISSSETTRDIETLLASFAVIYGAGRRFVAAIERVASDPLAPVHEALREAFNRFISDVIARAASLLEGVTSDLEEMKQFATGLRNKLAALFADSAFRAWRHLVFALPGTHAIVASFPGQQDAVDKKIQDLLVKAAADTDFFGVLLAKGPEDAAKVLGKAFHDALIEEIKKASPIQAALTAAYQDWEVAVGNGADREADRIKGLIYDAATEQLRPLLAAAQKLAGHAEPSIRNLIGDLKDAAAAALDLIRPIVDDSLAAVVQLCGKLALIVKSTIDAVKLPSPNDVNTARTEMGKAFDAAAAAVAKVGIDPEEVKAIGKALDDDVGTLVNVRDALQRALDQLLQLQADVCSASPDRLRLDAFAALGRMRNTLLDALHGFVTKVSSPHFRATDLKALLSKITGTSADADAARSAVIDAAKKASTVVITLCRLARDATALRETTNADGAMKKVRDDLAGLGNPKLNGIISIIDGAKSDAIALKAILDGDGGANIGIIKTLENKVAQAVTPANAQKYLDELLAEVFKVPDVIDAIQSRIVEGLERAVLKGLGKFLVAGEPYLQQMTLIAFQGLSPVFKFLSGAQTALVDARKRIWEALGGSNKDSGGTTPIGDEISQLTFEKVRALLLVSCSSTPSWPLGLSCSATPKVPDEDFLTAEKTELDALAAVFAANDPGQFDAAVFKALSDLFKLWSTNDGSTQRLVKQLADAAAAVLSGDLKRIVDLEGVRRRIEEKLKELVPARILLNYDMQAQLKDFPSSKPIFLPRPGSQITLSAGAVYNLLEPNVPPRFRATCKIDPFDINLFDVVTLMFSSAQFVNESGKGSDFDIVYKDFELGPNAAFLKPLQTLMNPGGSGPYVRPSSEVPGIEAGYSLDLGIISIGTVSFINVSINAACVLPFNGARATFVASIGREDRPVLLSIAPYTGGGFLALYADAQRLIGFAASFEFGGGGGFKFGPLTGQGRLTTGIYLRKMSKSNGDDDCVIEGFFYAGGEAHIACFAISATLVVRISHRQGGSMQGSAVFTFSFSIGFAKLRYQVGVQKNMGPGMSGSRSVAALVSKDLRLISDEKALPAAVVSCAAKAQQEDWLSYQSYFSDDLDGFPA